MKSFVVFSFIGVIVTLVAYSIYILLILLGFDYGLALAFDYLVGFFLGLFLHGKYTFKVSKLFKNIVIIRAVISNLIIFLINYLFLFYMIDVLQFNELLSQLLAIVAIGISSFIFYDNFIFGKFKDDK